MGRTHHAFPPSCPCLVLFTSNPVSQESGAIAYLSQCRREMYSGTKRTTTTTIRPNPSRRDARKRDGPVRASSYDPSRLNHLTFGDLRAGASLLPELARAERLEPRCERVHAQGVFAALPLLVNSRFLAFRPTKRDIRAEGSRAPARRMPVATGESCAIVPCAR